jgi:hypothetical protein
MRLPPEAAREVRSTIESCSRAVISQALSRCYLMQF